MAERDLSLTGAYENIRHSAECLGKSMFKHEHPKTVIAHIRNVESWCKVMRAHMQAIDDESGDHFPI